MKGIKVGSLVVALNSSRPNEIQVRIKNKVQKINCVKYCTKCAVQIINTDQTVNLNYSDFNDPICVNCDTQQSSMDLVWDRSINYFLIDEEESLIFCELEKALINCDFESAMELRHSLIEKKYK